MQTLSQKITLNCKGKLLVWENPIVMGIINATPDSFFSESRKSSVDEALKQAEKMLNEGATILDIGGYSTRPNADDVSVEDELQRTVPVVAAISEKFPGAIISIDTFRAKVAKAAAAAGAHMINDISAGEDDTEMLSTVATLGVPYILMHKKGTPKTMQQNPQYENVVLEVMDYLKNRVDECRALGIKDLIIDVGFGFGKNLQHNYELFGALNDFQIFGLPVLVGISRKGMIQKLLNVDAENSLNGTSILHTLALTKGATILRVHDVGEAVQCIKLFNAVNGNI